MCVVWNKTWSTSCFQSEIAKRVTHDGAGKLTIDAAAALMGGTLLLLNDESRMVPTQHLTRYPIIHSLMSMMTDWLVIRNG